MFFRRSDAQDRADRLAGRIGGASNSAQQHARAMLGNLTGTLPKRDTEQARGEGRLADRVRRVEGPQAGKRS